MDLQGGSKAEEADTDVESNDDTVEPLPVIQKSPDDQEMLRCAPRALKWWLSFVSKLAGRAVSACYRRPRTQARDSEHARLPRRLSAAARRRHRRFRGGEDSACWQASHQERREDGHVLRGRIGQGRGAGWCRRRLAR